MSYSIFVTEASFPSASITTLNVPASSTVISTSILALSYAVVAQPSFVATNLSCLEIVSPGSATPVTSNFEPEKSATPPETATAV